MSIEAIGSVVQPAMVMSARSDSQVELPSSAIKSVSPAEEEDMLKDATEKANELVKTMNKELRFSVDKYDGKTVVKVMDKNSGELIRQIPQDEMLAIA